MITIYTFGPAFGPPDSSPFVTKALALLKMAGLPFTEDRGGFTKAPKGKLPFIDDDGTIVADSTFIRFHIEKKYGFDFDAGLSLEQKAQGWAIEKMCEEHLYFALVHTRWMDEKNFAAGPAHLFDPIPMPVRLLARALVRRKVARDLKGQGFGRHTPAEIVTLALHDIDALSVLIGGKPYLFGERPCGADATVFAFINAILPDIFETPLRVAVESRPNLMAYRERLMKEWFA
jgi:glutathione S-transferase